MLRRFTRSLVNVGSDLLHLSQTHGIARVWSEVLDRTIYKAYRRGRLVIVEHSDASVTAAPTRSEIDIRKLSASDWPALEKITTQRTAARFRRYLSEGATCLCAWRDTEMLGYTWTTSKMFPGILSVPIELPPNCVYTWELYVIPSARSAGIGTQLAHSRHAYELKRGNSKTRRVVRLDNPSAIRTVEKTLLYDSRVVGEIRYTKVLNHFFVTRLAIENESPTVRRLREKAAGR